MTNRRFSAFSLVCKRFGEEINIQYYPNLPSSECSLRKEMTIEKGTLQDWNKLRVSLPQPSNKPKQSHLYTQTPKRIIRNHPLLLPIPKLRRSQYGPTKMALKELNQKLCLISRIVIHPKYRSIGLGEKHPRVTTISQHTKRRNDCSNAQV